MKHNEFNTAITEQTYNLAIIDDSIEVCQVISERFNQNNNKIQCVLAVDSIEKFIKFYRDFLNIKIILLDLRLYKDNSYNFIPLLRDFVDNTPIIMYSIHEDTDSIIEALKWGANGYLLKEDSLQELEYKLYRLLSENQPLLSSNVTQKIIQYLNGKSDDELSSKINQLSSVERITMNYLIEGMSYAEIANKLHLSIDGIRFRIKSIYKKLGVNSRKQLKKNN